MPQTLRTYKDVRRDSLAAQVKGIYCIDMCNPPFSYYNHYTHMVDCLTLEESNQLLARVWEIHLVNPHTTYHEIFLSELYRLLYPYVPAIVEEEEEVVAEEVGHEVYFQPLLT